MLLQISKTLDEFFFLSLLNGNTDRHVITLGIAQLFIPTAIFLVVMRKTNKLNQDFWTSLSRLPLHIGGKIVKIPSVRLVPKSISLCLRGLTSNFLKDFFSNS